MNVAVQAVPCGAPDAGGREPLYLLAGHLAVAQRPSVIATVLGSCVAVCLFDVEREVGGMNHFLLAHPVQDEQSPRFGTVAVPALIAAVVAAGARRSALEAKVFGGSTILGAGAHRLGDENAALALALLAEARIPVLQTDLGGPRGRKLIFHTDDGSAWVRQL